MQRLHCEPRASAFAIAELPPPESVSCAHPVDERFGGDGEPPGRPMRCGSPFGSSPVEASVEARRRADQLLQTLLAESALLESRLADSGRIDPIRAVSGRSAMDRAIESARALIGAADRLLAVQRCDAGRGT